MNSLRVFFILVVLLGLAALAVTHLKVEPKISGLEADLSKTDAELRTAQSDLRNERRTVRELTSQNETLSANLGEMEDQVKTLEREKEQQQVRADKHEADLETALANLNRTSQELSRWNALGTTIIAVKSMKDDLLKARREIQAGNMEREILLKQIDRLEVDLSRYEGDDIEVVMREGLKGLVVAVNPEWDFVVVDVGEKDGALHSGKMMVSRAGKLIGKIRLTTINEEQSIGNVLPEWKRGEVQVGDTVLY